VIYIVVLLYDGRNKKGLNLHLTTKQA